MIVAYPGRPLRELISEARTKSGKEHGDSHLVTVCYEQNFISRPLSLLQKDGTLLLSRYS